jgi:DNA repair protein RadC
MKVESQDTPQYGSGPAVTNHDDDVIALAFDILYRRAKHDAYFTDPDKAGAYFAVRSADMEHEVFSIALLDAQHGLIRIEDVSLGTINQAAVYPREIVKLALQANAAAVVLHHNHPSGSPEPSRSDEALTKTLKAALYLIEVRVIDHIVTGGGKWVSFAERGLI